MRVMVTGGTGFLGSHVCKALVEAGHEIRLLVRGPEKARVVMNTFEIDMPELVVGDITDEGSVKQALEGCDAAIHAAAMVSASPDREAELARVNVEGTRTVLESAVAAGCDPVIHISSSAALFPYQTDPVTPDHPIGTSKRGYGRSKAEAEAVARELQGAGAPLTIVYPTGIIGPHMPEHSEMFSAAQIWVAKAVPDSDEMKTGLVDVRDVARIVEACLEPGHGWRRYLAWGHLATMAEVGMTLRQLTGRDISMPKTPKAAIKAWGRVGDVARRLGKDLTLTSEGASYLFDFVDADQSATIDDLEVEYRSLADSFTDMYRWMHDEGYVSANQIGRLAA